MWIPHICCTAHGLTMSFFQWDLPQIIKIIISDAQMMVNFIWFILLLWAFMCAWRILAHSSCFVGSCFSPLSLVTFTLCVLSSHWKQMNCFANDTIPTFCDFLVGWQFNKHHITSHHITWWTIKCSSMCFCHSLSESRFHSQKFHQMCPNNQVDVCVLVSNMWCDIVILNSCTFVWICEHISLMCIKGWNFWIVSSSGELESPCVLQQLSFNVFSFDHLFLPTWHHKQNDFTVFLIEKIGIHVCLKVWGQFVWSLLHCQNWNIHHLFCVFVVTFIQCVTTLELLALCTSWL